MSLERIYAQGVLYQNIILKLFNKSRISTVEEFFYNGEADKDSDRNARPSFIF
jgi:hypothetical protein